MSAPTAGAHRPARPQPTRTAHAALPGPTPRRQPGPTPQRRALQPTAAQRRLDRRAVHAYRHHRCTPMHQDGPSASAKTGGRAVAYLQDVLTLASHTTADKDQPPPPRPGHHDQSTMTRSSSRKLAPNNRIGIEPPPDWAKIVPPVERSRVRYLGDSAPRVMGCSMDIASRKWAWAVGILLGIASGVVSSFFWPLVHSGTNSARFTAVLALLGVLFTASVSGVLTRQSNKRLKQEGVDNNRRLR
ncbi:MAG: hypothetical protein QOE37_2189, partial [Microbacteriaceae bacterium]|nr:hypothetical protein [Microbacteriaceae bacterium]